MGLWGLIGAGFCLLSVILLLRELRKEWVPYVIAAFGIAVFGFARDRLGEFLPLLQTFGTESTGEYVVVLCKALGIVWITHMASELCKTVGEAGLAGYMELSGRIELVALSMPLWKPLLELALSFL